MKTLFAALIGLTTNFALAAQGEPRPEVTDINSEDFYTQALSKPIPEATAKQTAQWLKNGEAVLIDLNDAEQFAHTHLKGAINLPGTSITDEALNVLVPDENTRLVLYCYDSLYPTRRIALTTLSAPAVVQLGYPNTFLLEPLHRSEDCKSAREATSPTKLCGNLLVLVDANEAKLSD